MTTDTASKGLEGVVAARTSLSDVKGDIGQLVYCGYDINELAGKVSFEEVIFLLHYNHLPNKKELADLKAHLIAERDLPQGVIDIIKKLPSDAPPMHALRTIVSALGCFDPECDLDSLDAQRNKALRLIARIPIAIAYFHRARQGKTILPPDATLGEAANFLYLIDGEK
ncbi:MAG: citrate/2-methylcitrate synthase, partial [Limisphaerales bacterium]